MVSPSTSCILSRSALRLLPLVLLLGASLASNPKLEGVRAGGDAATLFYGYAPSGVDETYLLGRGYAYLDVIGVNYSTSVRVFDLRTGLLIGEGVVGRMELFTIKLPLETYFKVEADKIVSVCLSAGTFRGDSQLGPRPPSGFTFITSVDGGFSGKEFIFMALESYAHVMLIYAVENSEVTVYNSTGSTAFHFSLGAYSYAGLALKPRQVYRVVSTGRLMIEHATIYGATIDSVPSFTGGFIGYTFPATIAFGGSLIILSQEDSTVKVHEITAGGLSLNPRFEKQLRLGENMSVPWGNPVIIRSTGRVLVERNGVGIAFMGLRAGEDAWVFIPDGGGVIFASAPTRIVVDERVAILQRDGIDSVQPGLHRIATNSTVLLELLGGFPVTQYAAYIVSPRGLEVDYPSPPEFPEARETPIHYYVAGVAALGSILIALLLVLRRRQLRVK